MPASCWALEDNDPECQVQITLLHDSQHTCGIESAKFLRDICLPCTGREAEPGLADVWVLGSEYLNSNPNCVHPNLGNLWQVPYFAFSVAK